MRCNSFPDKYSDRVIFSAKDVVAHHREDDELSPCGPEGVILCYQRGLAERLVADYDPTLKQGFLEDVFLLGSHGHRIAVVTNFGIGAPVAAIMLENLVAQGTRYVISLGTTGALQPHLRLGDRILCSEAIRDEGTSHHYLPATERVVGSAALNTSIRGRLEAEDLDFSEGVTWTTDAPYRETVGEVRKYQSEGVLSVEMEAAALFATASINDVAVSVLLVVSDSVCKDEWFADFHADTVTNSFTELFEVSVATLSEAIVQPAGV